MRPAFAIPFRASFSGSTLLIGDVGQSAVEEVDMMTTTQPGLNFGWRFLEGTQPYSGTAPGGLTPPVLEYLRGTGPRQGRTVTGGYVYRGPVTSLRGQYVFADFLVGNIWTVPFSSLVAGQTLPSSRFARRNEDFAPDAGTLDRIASFGEDSAGNLFLVGLDGEIFMVREGTRARRRDFLARGPRPAKDMSWPPRSPPAPSTARSRPEGAKPRPTRCSPSLQNISRQRA